MVAAMGPGSRGSEDQMIKKIELLEPYLWFGSSLPGGVVYEVGKQYNGHELKEKNAIQLIEEGYARQVE